MSNSNTRIAVIGAGLVGSVMASYLSMEGFEVILIERRPDPRKLTGDQGRSINLALSKRGIIALEEIGASKVVLDHLTPMKGRMMHDTRGELTFQPYGREGQCINSVSRTGLNIDLIERAEGLGCHVYFDTQIAEVDFEKAHVESVDGQVFEAEYIIAADGAYSAVRSEMMREVRFNYSQTYVDYGYKELTMPADHNGKHKMDINSLHIWPRGKFMLIALPNQDGTYTCTLFLPFEGENSFEQLQNPEDIAAFFSQYFPDVIPLIPDLLEDFTSNPTSSLVTIRCFPWTRGKVMLIGDACHAIVPFYGQGMNAGFEDCRIFLDFLRNSEYNWPEAMDKFQEHRKPDAEAIADLALKNFIEMRDLVADDDFLLRKKIEAKLHEAYPEKWIPLYTMVTFRDDFRYSDAYKKGLLQKKVMDDVMHQKDIHQTWETLDLQRVINQLGEVT